MMIKHNLSPDAPMNIRELRALRKLRDGRSQSAFDLRAKFVSMQGLERRQMVVREHLVGSTLDPRSLVLWTITRKGLSHVD